MLKMCPNFFLLLIVKQERKDKLRKEQKPNFFILEKKSVVIKKRLNSHTLKLRHYENIHPIMNNGFLCDLILKM